MTKLVAYCLRVLQGIFVMPGPGSERERLDSFLQAAEQSLADARTNRSTNEHRSSGQSSDLTLLSHFQTSSAAGPELEGGPDNVDQTVGTMKVELNDANKLEEV